MAIAGGLRLLEHRPGPALPPPRAHPAGPGHRGQRVRDGVRQPRRRLRAPASASPATRPPGEPGVYGDYLANAQGEDVVAGIRNTLTLADLAQLDPASHAELTRIMRRLETHYRDLCDIEFTIERGKLWMLQTRVGKRTAAAAFRIATQLVDERLINLDEALARVTGEQLGAADVPAVRRRRPSATLLTRGWPPHRGRPSARSVFDSRHRGRVGRRGEQVLLVRRETNPDDLDGMIAAAGHADQPGRQDLARRRRRPRDGPHLRLRRRGARRRRRGQHAAGRRDRRRRGRRASRSTAPPARCSSARCRWSPSPVVTYLERARRRARGADADAELVAGRRPAAQPRRRARAGWPCGPTPTPPRTPPGPGASARRASGCAGPSTCSSATAGSLIERLILADTADERRGRARRPAAAAARRLRRAARRDGRAAGRRSGCSTRRCTSSCPTAPSWRSRSRSPRPPARPTRRTSALLAAVERLHEQNPMLGLRGVRLGLIVPGLFAMQVRAIAEAAAAAGSRQGGDPRPEIMVPLVGLGDGAAPDPRRGRRRSSPRSPREPGVELTIPIGTMIELPRAALTARQIAEAAEFFSFGTNDLTQTTWGFSRDDVEGAFFAAYLEQGVFTVSPFESLDRDGVGRLVRIAVEEGRAHPARPQARRLRRARRRPRVGALLPRRRPRLRLLLAVPGPGRAAGGRPGGARVRQFGRGAL